MRNTIILAIVFVLACGVAGLAQGKKESESVLMGHWKSDEAVVEFRPKNVAILNGQKLEWAANEKIIALASDEGTMTIPYVLKGDTLTVWVEERKVIYKRIDADEARNSSPSVSNTLAPGSVPQDLVGKWCYQANVQSQGGGGRQSDICFILNANGTYQYSGETTSSNIYGGTSSQSRDSGRWSATANSLTAHSNSGKTTTYSLERRNHPKNGDPMLIVDGDAFVTYYQKRPW